MEINYTTGSTCFIPSNPSASSSSWVANKHFIPESSFFLCLLHLFYFSSTSLSSSSSSSFSCLVNKRRKGNQTGFLCCKPNWFFVFHTKSYLSLILFPFVECPFFSLILFFIFELITNHDPEPLVFSSSWLLLSSSSLMLNHNSCSWLFAFLLDCFLFCSDIPWTYHPSFRTTSIHAFIASSFLSPRRLLSLRRCQDVMSFKVRKKLNRTTSAFMSIKAKKKNVADS